MGNEWLQYLFGGIGAVIYGFPVWMTSRKTDVPFESSANFIYAIFVGTIFGGILVGPIGHQVTWLAKPTPYPLSVFLGLLANPVTPLIIERGKAFFNMAADILSGRLFRGRDQ